MSQQQFNYTLADAQGTLIEPLEPSQFDVTGYQEYTNILLERNNAFWQASSGVQVYRRFRVPSVFSYDSRDMKRSLALQLGALAASMSFATDIPNFLEPWYGIGAVTSAYGASYLWADGQAPATEPRFTSLKEAVNYAPVPIETTDIGQHTLRMITYFLEQTQGKIPMSFADVQSPLNSASALVDTNNFYLGVVDESDAFQQLLMIVAELTLAFLRTQRILIGDALVWPGHGFASSQMFRGLGMSADNMVMLSPRQYQRYEIPLLGTIGDEFGGVAFHSCGDWSRKIATIKQTRNLVMVDAAFSPQTDPSPNPPEAFAEAFAGTGVVVNARIVGPQELIIETVHKLWKPGMKLIVVTYCQTPQEQHAVYQKIHAICSA